MALATCTPDGAPSVRTVLYKTTSRPFVFFTNYNSRKGRELETNPRAALLFFWSDLQRQIRIEGGVTRLETWESDEYWSTRPLGSRISAALSPQSEPIPSRQFLLDRQGTVDEASRPAHWGGFRVEAATIELWQGQSDRLHDRALYTLSRSGWNRVRLAP